MHLIGKSVSQVGKGRAYRIQFFIPGIPDILGGREVIDKIGQLASNQNAVGLVEINGPALIQVQQGEGNLNQDEGIGPIVKFGNEVRMVQRVR